MESTIAVTINADPDAVYALASEVERWPAILPHYRRVRRVAGGGARRTLEMAAWRDIYPVRWTAAVESVPGMRCVRFTHLRGPTRGMDVEWRITPEDDGRRCRAAIWHKFHSSLPVIAPLYEWVVFHVFIENIAGKTLRCMKWEAEARPVEGGSGIPEPGE